MTVAAAALDAVAELEPFRAAGVLSASDVHTAAALVRLAEVTDTAVLLAAALAARAPRHGHVAVDLATAAEEIVAETDAELAGMAAPGEGHPAAATLAWPEPSSWLDRVRASPLTAGSDAPLVVDDGLLYVERYHRYESAVADQLLRRAATPVTTLPVDTEVADALLTGAGSEHQRAAVEGALRRALTVLVGGPGTGKSTTVAALLATLLRADPGQRIALAAPTGKAAARLGEALAAAAAFLPLDLAARLGDARPQTIHRLLGASWGRRVRHDAGHPLPHDVVIVDETSMVSLPLMARLLDAVRPDARLVLVGDPGQLASVEAGSVLGDLAGPITAGGTVYGPLAASVTELHHSRRFPPGSPIDRLAGAVRTGDVDAALASLHASGADGGDADHRVGDDGDDGDDGDRGSVRWYRGSGDEPAAADLVRATIAPAALEVHRLAAAGDAPGALAALQRVRLLCAHRHGPFGVEQWNRRVEGWLADAGVATSSWYVGRPVLVTSNDYRLNLFNGDLGVVVATATRPAVAFTDGSSTRTVSPAALDAIETVHAMTVHKSQGSEFDDVVVVLPPAASRLATRELLYTAITRARRRVTVIGDAAAVAAAVTGTTARTSGLGRRLWPS